jgi:hypothetical protein
VYVLPQNVQGVDLLPRDAGYGKGLGNFDRCNNDSMNVTRDSRATGAWQPAKKRETEDVGAPTMNVNRDS